MKTYSILFNINGGEYTGSVHVRCRRLLWTAKCRFVADGVAIQVDDVTDVLQRRRGGEWRTVPRDELRPSRS